MWMKRKREDEAESREEWRQDAREEVNEKNKNEDGEGDE
jgi:hypothetical protein